MKLSYRRLAALVVAMASLAVPASAWAHGSVYTDIAKIDTDPAQGPFTLADQTRHVVTNHGFTMLLRETNGASDKGMIDYSRLPGDYRASLTPSQALAEGDTAAQPTRRAGARRARPTRRSGDGRTPTPSITTSRSKRQPPAWRTILLAGSRTSSRSAAVPWTWRRSATTRRSRSGARGVVRGPGRDVHSSGPDPDEHGQPQQWLRPRADRAAGRGDPPAHRRGGPTHCRPHDRRRGQRLPPLRRSRRRRRPTRRTRH